MKETRKNSGRAMAAALMVGAMMGLTLVSAPAFSQVSFDLHVGDPVIVQQAQPVVVEPAQTEVIAEPPVAAQCEGIAAVPPPAPIVEVQPTIVEAPAPDVIWVPGYYDFDEHVHRYHWVEGAWRHQPQAGAAWVAPRYDGGRYYAGHWGNSAGTNYAARGASQSAQMNTGGYASRGYANRGYAQNGYANNGYSGYQRGAVSAQQPSYNGRTTTTTTTTTNSMHAQRGYAVAPNSIGNRGYMSGSAAGAVASNQYARTSNVYAPSRGAVAPNSYASRTTTTTTTNNVRGYVGTSTGATGYARTNAYSGSASGAVSNGRVSAQGQASIRGTTTTRGSSNSYGRNAK